MREKVYFIFFIFCAILSEVILALEEDVDFKAALNSAHHHCLSMSGFRLHCNSYGAFGNRSCQAPDSNTTNNQYGESSKLLIRQKRVIDRRPGHDKPLRNGELPYVINVRENRRLHCVGTILSRHTAITAAQCVESPNLYTYTVLSGSVYSFRGNEHNVTEKKTHVEYPLEPILAIALITVNPPFTFNSNTGSIGLHSVPDVLPGMMGLVPGWANRVGNGPVESKYVTTLRAIHVPIMSHQACQGLYARQFPVTEDNICTYDPQKACGNTDAGAPLIIDNQLVGVHIGEFTTRLQLPVKPDVFILIQHLNYRPWIMSNIVH